MAKRTAALILTLGCLVAAANGQVKMSTVSYSCCDAEIRFDPGSENTFSINATNIAYYNSGLYQCVSPCEKIDGGVMKLKDCIPMNLTTVYTDADNVPHESRTVFEPKQCPGPSPSPSPGPGPLSRGTGISGCGCLWQLAAVGYLLKQIIYL